MSITTLNTCWPALRLTPVFEIVLQVCQPFVVGTLIGPVLSTPFTSGRYTTTIHPTAMYSPAGTHSPANVGTGPIEAILVEFKGAAPGKAVLPTTPDNMTIKVLAEGARGAAYRTTAAPTFSEPAGSKHDYDQIVIALGAAQMSLSIDGKPAKTSWTRGEVAFIGRGVAHESKNTSGKPIDYVIVGVK